MSSPKGGLSSKAAQMRAQLQMKAKERENFETMNKSLLAEMETEKMKLGAIRQGLRNNEVSFVPPDPDDLPSPKNSNSISPFGSSKQLLGDASNQSLANSTNSSTSPSPSHKTLIPKKPGQSLANAKASQSAAQMSSGTIRPPAIPSGPRMSDWCYTGSLDSQPPTMKTNTLYETIRLLGRGAFGDVNLMKITGENKFYACKTIFSEKESNLIASLEEVRFLRANRHPCIIDVYDTFVTEKPRVLYIVMPFCEGGDLGNQINTAKKNNSFIPESSIMKWALQTGLALQFLHNNNTIHRDIKPNNVMLTDGGDLAKLGDFGLALELKTGRCESTAECGTPLYYAPEMVKGLPYAFPADCWSFGVMLHELLSLDRPFKGTSTADLANAIMNEKTPPIPSHYSPEMKGLVESLLIKDPAERMTFTQMLNDPMFCSRMTAFAASGYRPKAIEERMRRANVRQLNAQIEQILNAGHNTGGSSSLSLNATAESVIPVTDVESLDLLDDSLLLSLTPPNGDVLSVPPPEDSDQTTVLAAESLSLSLSETTEPMTRGYYIQKDSLAMAVPTEGGEEEGPTELIEPIAIVDGEEGENEEADKVAPHGGRKGQAIAEAIELSSALDESLVADGGEARSGEHLELPSVSTAEGGYTVDSEAEAGI